MSGQEGDILIVACARLESNWCSLCSMNLLLGVSMQDWQKIGSCMISFGITQPDENLPRAKDFACNSSQGCLDKADCHCFPQGNPHPFVLSQILVVLLTLPMADLLSAETPRAWQRRVSRSIPWAGLSSFLNSPELRNF